MNRLAGIGILLSLGALAAGCGGGGGGGDSPQAAATTVSLSANPTSVAAGQTATISWSSENATTCSPSGGWSSTIPTSGDYQTAPLTSTTVYSVSCTGPSGETDASVTITVSPSAANDTDPDSPYVTLSASPGGVMPGDQATLTWNARNVTDCTASNGWSGPRSISGGELVGPLQEDTTYQLTCSGAGGNAIAMTTVSLRVARLTWQAPDENNDGSALTDLAGYKVFWGPNPRTYTQSALVDGANNTSYTVNLSPGAWYFAVTARNASGQESDYSDELSRTVN